MKISFPARHETESFFDWPKMFHPAGFPMLESFDPRAAVFLSDCSTSYVSDVKRDTVVTLDFDFDNATLS